MVTGGHDRKQCNILQFFIPILSLNIRRNFGVYVATQKAMAEVTNIQIISPCTHAEG